MAPIIYVNPEKATRYEAFKIQEKVGKKIQKEKQSKINQREKTTKALLATFKRQKVKGQRRAIARRAAGTRRLLGALGVSGTGKGRGRPRGTYKYGMPIQAFKKEQSRRKALYQVFKQQQQIDLARRGLTPEQIQQIQYQRTLEQGRLPTQQQSYNQQRRLPIQIPNQEFEETPEGVMAVADDELEFRRFAAKKAISPNTQQMLVRLRRIQLKSLSDDVEMQRRMRERKMLAAAGNILETPFIFNRFQMDVTKLAEGDKEILKAPNVFREDPNNFILKKRGFNILQTGEAGNNLNFF